MKATDVANYLVYLLSDVCEDLSNMKLNKLVYYAQGYHCRRFATPFFDDAIEAWEHGPVVPSVYAQYKQKGNAPISEWDQARVDAMPDEDADLLVDVARVYGRYTAAALRNMTHQLGGPWDQSYVSGQYRTVIPIGVIEEFFESDKVQEIDLQIPEPADEDCIGYRDAEGVFVLPKEWDDGEIDESKAV